MVRADLEEEGLPVDEVDVGVDAEAAEGGVEAAEGGVEAGDAKGGQVTPSSKAGRGAAPAPMQEVDLDDLPKDGEDSTPGSPGARDMTHEGRAAQREVAEVRALSDVAERAAAMLRADEATAANALPSAEAAASASTSPSASAAAPKDAAGDAAESGGTGADETGKGAALVQAEGKEAGAVTWATYMTYFSAAGGPCQLIFTGFLLVAGTLMVVFTQYWLTLWSQQSEEDQEDPGWWGAYLGIALTTVLLSGVRTTVFFLGAVASSKALHDRMMAALLRAPLTHFDANPAGRILNRVSKDVGFVDDLMPMTSFDFLNIALLVLVATATVCVANPYLLICAVPFLGFLVWLRGFFLKSAREIKRQEAVSRSAVFGSLSEALDGVVPARALGLEAVLAKHSDAALDLNARAYYMFLVASRWLGYRLDLMCVAFNAAAALGCIFLRGRIDPGLVGLSLTLSLQLTSVVQWCMRQSAELEQQMISVERLLEYARLPQEDVDLEEEEEDQKGSQGTVTGDASPATSMPSRASSQAQLLASKEQGSGSRSLVHRPTTPATLAASAARKAKLLQQSAELFARSPSQSEPTHGWPAVPAV